ncbi:hypothetical protein QR680_001985 [Steinernema hermaphroditum]|uniref:Uncharacterized protein n=1 Tax=Steinernema hermaphroditum TaxID=289476 RepID=A0AA39H0R4_9BILA|nr:hypothetical protein QR680_001985 [Steinernema hermaphroditum]
MQAVMVGRSRNGPRARYMYTGSLNPTDKYSCLCRLCYMVSSISAVSGTMFTVFGLTGFFSTKQMNVILSCFGVLALFLALGCISIGLYLSRQSEKRKLCLTPRLP